LRFSFPWLALGLGLVIAMVLISAGAVGPAAGRSLPLLTLLMAAEFGFFLNAIGAGLAIRQLIQQGLNPGVILSASGCVALAAGFAWLGLQLWPGTPPGVA
jgi:hypothetical protein